MTKREIIYTVLEKLSVNSDDAKISEELVSSMIDTKRALLLKQRFSKASWNIPIEVRQEICMPIGLVDVIAGYSGGGKILKTTEAIPSSIKIKGWTGPLLIRKEDGSAIAINLIPIERLPYIGNNRFIAQLTYAAQDLDGKLILISSDNKLNFLKKIRVTHIFENPEIAYSKECKDNNMSGVIEPWDIDYPVELAMVNEIVDMVISELSRKLNIPEDKTNDANESRR